MDCVSKQTIWPHRSIDWIDAGNVERPVTVPCGRCLPCLINKRSDWSFRLEQEFKASQSAIFVTLTYDTKHCPSDGSLNKKHVQLYLKRLRKKDGTNKIRYYAVGEYGGKSGRPHYHLLLFNCCSTEHARQSWTDKNGAPVGIVHIGAVTSASVAYVTKYIVQPDLAIPHLQKPFSLMSRAYGIGAHYLTQEMIDWHRDDDRNYTMRYGQKGRLPRYYREKIWYRETDKSRISEESKWLAIRKKRQELRYYWKNHPHNWKEIIKEGRNALLSRVKQKFAFTQTL